MWLFDKKLKFIDTPFLKGMTDFHCHILPGVDDGVKTLDEALKILSEYERLGISQVWFTPHIMEDIPNETSALRSKFEELKTAYSGPLKLNLASENMLDGLYEERLFKNDLLPLGGHYLLVETSYFNPPFDLTGMLKRTMSAGYFPILAHPERYIYMSRKHYQKLKEMGVLFQGNITSFFGAYGEPVRRRAESIAKNGWYNCIGTDLHNMHTISRMELGHISKSAFEKIPNLESI